MRIRWITWHLKSVVLLFHGFPIGFNLIICRWVCLTWWSTVNAANSLYPYNLWLVTAALASKDCKRAWWPDSSCGCINWTISLIELSRTTRTRTPETWWWMCLTAAGLSKDWRRAWRQIHLVAGASNFLVFAQQSSQQMSSVIFSHFFLGREWTWPESCQLFLS